MTRLLTSMFAVFAVGCAAAHPGIDALRPHVLPLSAPWPEELPAAVAARFRSQTSERRFIALGEGDHNIADKFPYRLAFLRELTAAGVHHIGVEMGPSDAARIDRYLETGDEDSLRRVVLFGFTGDSAREKRDLAFYTRQPATQRSGIVRLGEEEKRFYRALRAVSERARATGGERLHLFGFDLDETPAGGYEDARRQLASCAPGPDAEEVLEGLTQPAGISGYDEAARLETLATTIDDRAAGLAGACGADSVAALRETVSTLAASFRQFLDLRAAQADDTPEGPEHLRTVFARREVVLEHRFLEHLATLPSDAHVALLLHALHAARDSESLRIGPAFSLHLWRTIGSRLEDLYPGQSAIVWLLYARGTRIDARDPSGAATVVPQQGSLEAGLDTIPGPYAVFQRDVPPGSVFDSSIRFGTDTAYGEGVLRGHFDVLVFLPRADAPPTVVVTR